MHENREARGSLDKGPDGGALQTDEEIALNRPGIGDCSYL
jgi:hypothetical protein